jgi:type IV secretion system protein TrbG
MKTMILMLGVALGIGCAHGGAKAYRLEGEAPWKPLRAYRDGEKTVLEMPANVRRAELPILVIDRGGEMEFANWRFEDAREGVPQGMPRLVVDTVFNKAVLFTGVGASRREVTITRL